MKIKRAVVVAAVVLLVLTVVLIEAVGAKVVSSLATDEQNIITDLHMSDSCVGPDMVLFPADTNTVYVVFDYSNMQPEKPYRIAVTDGVDLYSETHSYKDSGTACITVTHTSGSIPPDTYRTQIWDGTFPIKTQLWHVRPGGPGEITNLHMSISPDGPRKEKFMEGTKTVWAVFDYADMEGNEVGIDVHEGLTSFYESPRVSLTGSGTKAMSVTHYLAAGFPAGEYRTHVVKDEFVDVKPHKKGKLVEDMGEEKNTTSQKSKRQKINDKKF